MEEIPDEQALAAAYMLGVEHGRRLHLKECTEANRHGTVMVDRGYHWRPMSSCPLGRKVQLLTRGNVAVHGVVSANNIRDFTGWTPLPTKSP